MKSSQSNEERKVGKWLQYTIMSVLIVVLNYPLYLNIHLNWWWKLRVLNEMQNLLKGIWSSWIDKIRTSKQRITKDYKSEWCFSLVKHFYHKDRLFFNTLRQQSVFRDVVSWCKNLPLITSNTKKSTLNTYMGADLIFLL